MPPLVVGQRIHPSLSLSLCCSLQGRLVETPEELFEDGYLRVECVAKYDDYLFDKKELALARQEPQHSRRQLAAPSGYSPYAAGGGSRRHHEG